MTARPPSPSDVVAAGVVVLRAGREVLLVHRPRYDDWSFPKGKLDPGEHEVTAAVREVAEETGLHVRLGPPLPSQHYPVAGGRTKTVHYWTGRVVGDDDVSGYAVNDEIDDVVWLPWTEAARRLTYPRDREILEHSRPLRKPTQPLVVLRHAHALPRQGWSGDDRLRPLSAEGTREAPALVPLLAAYGVERVVTSSSARCVQTVAPYAECCGAPVEEHPGLSEEKASAESVLDIVDELLQDDESAVLCTHRPVLPSVFDVLRLPDPGLEKGEMLVLHHRGGRVVATETHRPR